MNYINTLKLPVFFCGFTWLLFLLFELFRGAGFEEAVLNATKIELPVIVGVLLVVLINKRRN